MDQRWRGRLVGSRSTVGRVGGSGNPEHMRPGGESGRHSRGWRDSVGIQGNGQDGGTGHTQLRRAVG